MSVRSLLIGVSIAALGTAAASAADLIIPTTPQPIYEAAGFDWEGLYIGARAGGQWTGGNGYTNHTLNSTYGVIGAAVGVNFIPVDPFLLGVEVTGDYTWNSVNSGGEFFANLRAGAVVTDAITVRGELVGQGDFSNAAGDQFFEAAKATVGVFYHF